MAHAKTAEPNITIDPSRIERQRAARLAEDERLVCMERARILLAAEREHASLARVPRQAAVLRDLCERITPVIRDDDTLVGRMPEVIPTDEEEALIAERPELFVEPGVPGWFDSISICVPEWDLLLARGLGGIAEDARERLCEVASDSDRAQFYRAAISAMESVSTLIRRYAARARDLADSADHGRAAELRQIAARCQHVAWEPPRDLPEALQLLQIVHMVLSCLVGGRDVTPGRLDQYLLRFYRASIDSGRPTRDEAVTLLAEFFLRLSQTAGHGPNHAASKRRSPCRYSILYVTVGGVDRARDPAENELSLAVAEAVRVLDYEEPTLLLRYHPEIDRELLRTVCGLVADQLPVTVYNDPTVISGFVEHGMSEHDARGYAHAACNNAFIPGLEAGSGPGGFHNVPRMLLDAIEDIAATEGATFEDLMRAFTGRMREALVAAREGVERRWERDGAHATPLLHSCLMRAALDAGESCWRAAPVSHLNHYLVGIATTIDSLIALHEIVFGDDAQMSLRQFAAALSNDWVGHEDLRRRIQTELPRFGQDHPLVHEVTGRVGNLWCDEVQLASEGLDRFEMWPGFYSFMNHIPWGEQTSATPDGRRSGEPLSENLAPSRGTPSCPATSHLLSMSALPMHRTPAGGATLTVSFGELEGARCAEVVEGLMEAYFDLGGLHLQFNVVDRATLLDAFEHPDAHRDLMVRVAGYNAYFVLLPEAEQQDIIRRCEV